MVIKMTEEKCGLGCKIAKAKNKILSYPKKAYNAANGVYDEYKTTNAKYEKTALRKTAAPAGQKKKTAASAKKENSLGNKIFKTLQTAAENASKNPQGPFSLYNEPAPVQRRKTSTGNKTKQRIPQTTGWDFNLTETQEWDFNLPESDGWGFNPNEFGDVPKAPAKKKKSSKTESNEWIYRDVIKMMMHTTPIKTAPRTAESLEKYKFINIRQDGNPEYVRFSETYGQVRKGRWELSGIVQASQAAIKNPAKYPDLADEWLDGKVHRLNSPTTFSSAEVLEQIKYEFKAAKIMKNKYLRVTGTTIDEPEKKKSGCRYSGLKKPAVKRTTTTRRKA